MTRYRDRCTSHDDPRIAELDDAQPAALIAWRKACAHLRDQGITPLPPPYVVRALRRRGWWPSGD